MKASGDLVAGKVQEYKGQRFEVAGRKGDCICSHGDMTVEHPGIMHDLCLLCAVPHRHARMYLNGANAEREKCISELVQQHTSGYL